MNISLRTNTVRLNSNSVIIFIGSAGSGKSNFWKNYLPTYTRINRDTLKTKEKCLKVAKECILKGESIVIDNTSPNVADRKPYISLAKENGYSVSAFYFNYDKDLVMHLNSQRSNNNHRTHFSGKVASMIIHSFFKNHEKIEAKEGFDEIKEVAFVPGPFENEKDKEAFFSY